MPKKLSLFGILLLVWQDLLTVELRWGNREGPYPDRLTVHRKGKPGQQEEETLAHELRCWPNIPQVCFLVFLNSKGW